MEARVLTYAIPSAQIDAAVRLWNEKVLPGLRQQRGFGGGLVLTSAASGKALVISLWQSEADRNAYESTDEFKTLLADVQSVIEGSPTIEEYDVSIRE
ncbi:MAG: antibiotic biosynthesis monooxygenase [Dehalococcoidia bacterium]